MAVDPSKALVLGYSRGGGFIVYTVPKAAFVSAHLDLRSIAEEKIGAPRGSIKSIDYGVAGVAAANGASLAVAAFADARVLDIGGDGLPTFKSPLNRWSAAVTKLNDTDWVAAVGDVRSFDGRVVLAERPEFAGAYAAMVQAAS